MTMAPSFQLCKCFKAVCLLLVSALRGSICFISLTCSHRHYISLRMGYLDNLSPEQPEYKPEKKKSRFSNTPKKRSGGIPSGRGPDASYLEIMATGGSSAPSDDKEDVENGDSTAFTNPLIPAGWSGAYLTEFLDGKDDSRTDIHNLLTQRSIQSFMWLLEKCRDPHSAKWIQEDFLQTGNLLDFHGTGAGFIERFGGTWDASLIAMIQKPKDRIIVSAKRRGRGHGGWSRNNPYLEERWMEMPIDIDPPNLVSRILSVREQIASEWVNDLDVLVQANNMILDSYFAKIRRGREQDSTGGEAVGDMDMAFDRVAVNLMNDQSRFAATMSSPFRRANFDLLYNLCTQAAIHRILREHKAEGKEQHSVPFCFLRDFYTERAAEYFDGDLQYGRADDFIEELLQKSPAVLSTEDGRTGLTDPLGAAENIIRMRNKVANEWKESMGRVKEDHIGVRQALLSKRWDSSGSNDSRDETAFQ